MKKKLGLLIIITGIVIGFTNIEPAYADAVIPKITSIQSTNFYVSNN